MQHLLRQPTEGQQQRRVIASFDGAPACIARQGVSRSTDGLDIDSAAPEWVGWTSMARTGATANRAEIRSEANSEIHLQQQQQGALAGATA